MEGLVKGDTRNLEHGSHIYMYVYVYIFIDVYIYMYIYICVDSGWPGVGLEV